MQNEIPAPSTTQDFGMTDQDVKNYKVQSFFGKIKFYLTSAAPAFIRVLNAIIYYLIKFIKSFVTSVFRMLMGKEV